MKFFDIFLIFAQNIDCGYTLEPPQRGGSNEYPQSLFWSKNKKNIYTRVKVGCKGVFITWTCYPDADANGMKRSQIKWKLLLFNVSDFFFFWDLFISRRDSPILNLDLKSQLKPDWEPNLLKNYNSRTRAS